MGGDSSGEFEREEVVKPDGGGLADYLDPVSGFWGPSDPLSPDGDTQARLLQRDGPDISDVLFAGDEDQFRRLREDNELYFDYAVLSLLRQSTDGIAEFGRDVDFRQVMVSPGALGRLANWFLGFTSEEQGVIPDERLPTFDVELATGYQVTFRQRQTGRSSRVFRVRVMGIGGTGRTEFSCDNEDVSGPYPDSRQLQAPVNIRWKTYLRKSTGDRIAALEFEPTGTAGLYAVARDAPSYKAIDAPRDERLRVINAGPSRCTWTVRKGHRSDFQCPVSLDFGSFSSMHMVSLESEATGEFGLELSNDGAEGHLYGDRHDAVLLRTGP